MELVALDNDFFLVKFFSVDDYEYAKLGGPWMVMDHYLMVKDWVPNFDPATDETRKLIVWVRFPDLPVEYYDYSFLMRLGELVGEPKHIDDATSLVSRGRFARMCIEVDLAKPLIAKFLLRKKVRIIEYEGLHLVCFKCGVYGHMTDACKAGEKGTWEEKSEQGDRFAGSNKSQGKDVARKERPETTESFDSWMLASKPVRRNYRTNGKKEQMGGSRFAILGENTSEINRVENGNNGEETELAVGTIEGENIMLGRGPKQRMYKGKRPSEVINEKQIDGENATEYKSSRGSTSYTPQQTEGRKG